MSEVVQALMEIQNLVDAVGRRVVFIGIALLFWLGWTCHFLRLITNLLKEIRDRLGP